MEAESKELVSKSAKIEDFRDTENSKDFLVNEEKEETVEEQGNYIYVYGIIEKYDIKLEDIKVLKNMPIQKIDFKDVSALTSFYPTLNAVLKEDEAMQHANILKNIAEKTTLIPMSFGTVFKDEDILETVLSKSYQAIKQTLKLIEGKIELGLKVVKNELEDVNNSVAMEILESLGKLSIKSIKGDNFSERLLLNHSFLLEKNKFSEFSEEIAKLEEKHKNLKFIYTGPWPPYSFVNIKISGS